MKLLDEAIAEFEKVLVEEKKREDTMKQLEATAALGGTRGLVATNEIKQMQNADQLERNKQRIKAEARKKRAERLVAADDGSAAREAALKAEQERLKKIDEEKKAKDQQAKSESRARLAAKAAAFGKG